MNKHLCTVCGYIYNEEKGDAAATVSPHTPFSLLPEKWMCPICGASKSLFKPLSGQKPEPDAKPASKTSDLSVLKKSVICSNLARGCEKQFKLEEKALFNELSDSLKSRMAKPEDPTFSALHEMVDADIQDRLPSAKETAKTFADRGALRAIVWVEKVSRIHSSLLSRYAEEGDAMLENTHLYVCPICGFIATGDTPPQKCPVCSVPEWMFEEVE